MLKSGLAAFIVVALTVGAMLSAAADDARKPAISAAQIKDAPLTIAASTVGQFAKGRSWYLSVNSAGQADLTIDTFPERTVKRFEISKQQFAEFRKALAEERFFELNGDYGQHVPDGSEDSLTVVAGQHSNTVKVRFLMNWVHSEKAKLREPSRAVRLIVLIRGWIDVPEAVDLRKYDKMVLDAAKE